MWPYLRLFPVDFKNNVNQGLMESDVNVKKFDISVTNSSIHVVKRNKGYRSDVYWGPVKILLADDFRMSTITLNDGLKIHDLRLDRVNAMRKRFHLYRYTSLSAVFYPRIRLFTCEILVEKALFPVKICLFICICGQN